jgi:serpin B
MKLAEQATADAAFGTDLYTRLAGPGNVVFSPASIAAALRMALVGARGETANEMARALHLSFPEAAAGGLRHLTEIAAASDGLLSVYNTAWISSALSVRADFLDQPVTVERADFTRQPEAARQAINAAVAGQTAGKITDLIQPGLIGALTRLVLVNAIYFKARWEHQFPPRDTRKEPFFGGYGGVLRSSARVAEHLEGPAPTQVDMMHMRARLAYHHGDGFATVLLPYEGGPLAMAVVLPDGPLPELAGRLDGLGGVSGVLRGVIADRTEYDVDLRLPKFTVTAAFLLRDTLQALGMGRAFSAGADFSGITDEEPVQISEVVHKAFIDIDEQGTEAAAATAVIMRAAGFVQKPPAKRVVVTVDRPFLFAIVETASGLPLFLGQVTRP